MRILLMPGPGSGKIRRSSIMRSSLESRRRLRAPVPSWAFSRRDREPTTTIPMTRSAARVGHASVHRRRAPLAAVSCRAAARTVQLSCYSPPAYSQNKHSSTFGLKRRGAPCASRRRQRDHRDRRIVIARIAHLGRPTWERWSAATGSSVSSPPGNPSTRASTKPWPWCRSIDRELVR
jgi:hypothetical protein